MRYLIVFLSLSFAIFAHDFSQVVTENDPSTLVEGVSVITGDLYTFEEDYVVRGARSISVNRSYLSRDGFFRTLQHLTASFLADANVFRVREPSGSVVIYHPDPNNRLRPDIGKHFFGEDEKPLRYNAFSQDDKGISNTKSGQISAHTNLKNQHLLIQPNHDKHGKSFTIYTSNGTTRRYVGLKNQQKVSDPFLGTYYMQYVYKLESETFPEGYITRYVWDENERHIKRIYTTNLNQSKIFSALDIPTDSFSAETSLKGSDQRSITFQFLPTDIKNFWLMAGVFSPDFSEMHLHWDFKEKWVSEKNKHKVPYLSALTLPSNRQIQISYEEYEDPAFRKAMVHWRLAELDKKIELSAGSKKKELKHQRDVIQNIGLPAEYFLTDFQVKTLSAPVGENQALIPTHTFVYEKGHKSSFVLDAQNNKTAYFWNDDYRLTQILRYSGTDQLYQIERFLWEGTNLKGKILLDKDSNPISAHTYQYDAWGNILEETFYGQLSGEAKSLPLKIASNGFLENNGVETYVKKASYSQDNHHLLLKQEEPDCGLLVNYSYLPNTHLLKSKSVCAGPREHILHTYEYDEDLLLTKETIQDAISHTWKKWILRTKDPYIGLPEILEEGYGDNTLLRKTLFHYGPGATITRKDIYDAEGRFCYSLFMTYDDKGRLTSETNPIGQKAIYSYDEVGNRIYAKEFTGRLETFYTYDYSNRLTQKEERGEDGTNRIYRYTYDTKHNLITETDPYGHTTTYLPDAFGHQKAIHLPPLLTENGESLPITTLFEYDCAGNPILKTDPAGHLTKTAYNAYGKPIQITHPDGAIESFTYYLNGLLKTSTDANQDTTSYQYDYLGRLIAKKRAYAEETYEYVGQYLKRKTDPEGNTTLYDYDPAGRKTAEEHAGERTTYTYDSLGRLRTTQKGDLLTITEYDLLDRIIEERNESPSGELFRKVRYEYDPSGRTKTTIRSINDREEREIHEYDSFNRLIKKTDALGFIDTYAYDPTLHKNTHTDPNGLQTIEIYNAQNLLSSLEKRKDGKTLSLQEKYYDPNGHLTLQIDTIYTPNKPPRTVRTTWQYNSRGLLTTLIEADGTPEAKTTHYTYTPRGEPRTITKPNGILLTYTYNDLGHLTSLSSSDGTVNHRMSYNLLGHLQTSDRILRTTDPFGRLLSERFPSYTLENTYDLTGRRITCAIPLIDCLITYTYDPAHLKQVTRSTLNHQPLYTHTYTSYDLSGNLLDQQLILNQGILRYTLDPLSRRSALTAPHFTQQILTYDAIGNITAMSINNDTLSYTYDPLYQLLSEKDHTYLYDSLYNRIAKDRDTYDLNSLNQPLSLTYDKNGNLTQYKDTRFTYDALDRLIRLDSPACTRTFTYDFSNRCLSTTASYWFSSETLYFLYDGQNEIGALDTSLRPQSLRILGSTPHAEIGSAIAIELQGQVYIPIHDLQGNLAALSLPNQKPTLYRYTAFGEELTPSTLSPWRFSSKRTDGPLVNFGRRYYLPALGRWLTPDPAGFTDGMNLYAYLHNDPLTHLDEYGLIMTAKDYRTTQQIARAPWETERPWNTLSYYGRNIASQTAHDIFNRYSGYYESAQSLRAYSPFYSSQPPSVWDGRQAIDGFFGTDIAIHNHIRDCRHREIGMSFAELPNPANLLGGLGKICSSANKALRSVPNFDFFRKIFFRAKEYANPHGIRFSQPTASQNFSQRGTINDMITDLRSGRIKVEDIPIIRVVEKDGKLITLDNRRLVAFQNAGIKRIPIQRVSLNDVKISDEFYEKFNPINDGKLIVIIPNANHRKAEILSLRSHGKIE